MEKMLKHVYDGDDYMYRKRGESETVYKKRMAELQKQRQANMSDEDKKKVAEVLKGLADID